MADDQNPQLPGAPFPPAAAASPPDQPYNSCRLEPSSVPDGSTIFTVNLK